MTRPTRLRKAGLRSLGTLLAIFAVYVLVFPNPFVGQWFGLITVGKPAPAFALTDLDGSTVRLEDLRGRPLVINFWATWCPDCRTELPLLQSAYEQYGGQVAFLTIASDDAESGEHLRAFLERHDVSLPTLQRGRHVSWEYRVAAIPVTYFIDADGVIQYHVQGPLNRTNLAAGLAAISP